jgi:hypothetical protein
MKTLLLQILKNVQNIFDNTIMSGYTDSIILIDWKMLDLK